MSGRLLWSLVLGGALLTSPSWGVTWDVAWYLEEGSGGKVADEKGQVTGTLVGGVEWADGLKGKALRFDGKTGVVKFVDSALINTGGPYQNRTVMALFNCDDVSVSDRKQTIYEEGGRTRGLVIYVHDGLLYVGGWNRAEYNWGGEWISAEIDSGKWYYVALVLREAQGKVEDDKFEMWLNGELVEKRPGGQLHAHGDDTGIGAVNQNTVFHDEDGSGTDIHHFAGLIDEVLLTNAALTPQEIRDIALDTLAVLAPHGKLATTWAALKR